MKSSIKKWINPSNGEVRLYFNDGFSCAKVWLVAKPEFGNDFSIKWRADHYSDFSSSYRNGCKDSYSFACNLVDHVAKELGLRNNFSFAEAEALTIS